MRNDKTSFIELTRSHPNACSCQVHAEYPKPTDDSCGRCLLFSRQTLIRRRHRKSAKKRRKFDIDITTRQYAAVMSAPDQEVSDKLRYRAAEMKMISRCGYVSIVFKCRSTTYPGQPRKHACVAGANIVIRHAQSGMW